MARKALGLLLVCLFAGISHSEGACELSKKGVSLGVGESYSDDDECIRYTCNKDGLLEQERCQRPDPATFPDKKCKTVERKGIFPNCCPQVQCPKGANLDEVKFIQKRTAESANLIVKRFRPISEKMMPDQIVVKRNWQPGSMARDVGAGFGDAARKVGAGMSNAMNSISCALFGCKDKIPVPPDGNVGRPGGPGPFNLANTMLLVFRMIGSLGGVLNMGELRGLEFSRIGNIGAIPFTQFPSLYDLNTGDLKGMPLGDLGALSPTGLQGINIEFLRALGLNIKGKGDMNNLRVRDLIVVCLQILGNLIASGQNLGDFNRLTLEGKPLNSINFDLLDFGDLGKLTVGDLNRLRFGLVGEMEGWGKLENLNLVSLLLILIHGYKNVYPMAQIPQVPVVIGGGGSDEGKGSNDNIKIIETPGDVKILKDLKEYEELKAKGYKIIGSWGNVETLDKEKLKELGIDPEDLKKAKNIGNEGNFNLQALGDSNGINVKNL